MPFQQLDNNISAAVAGSFQHLLSANRDVIPPVVSIARNTQSTAHSASYHGPYRWEGYWPTHLSQSLSPVSSTTPYTEVLALL